MAKIAKRKTKKPKISSNYLHKAYKYRIYPTEEQAILIDETIHAARFIYNKMLDDKIVCYQYTYEDYYAIPSEYKKLYPWLKKVDSLALANAWTNLNTAFKNFFKNPKKVGFPKFKSKKKSKWSYTTNNQKGTVAVINNGIKLPKVGVVSARLHRVIPTNTTIKSATITKTRTNQYFVSVLVEYDNQILQNIPKTFIGLDYSMSELYVDSNGNIPKYPKFYRKAIRRLARANRRLSRTQKGSKNHEKARRSLAKIHEKIANQRLDFLHKKSTWLADNYDCVAIEDISVKDMAKRKKDKKFSFGKSVSDNGWGIFVSLLAYKLAWRGRMLIKVNKWYSSSQLCHVCGTKNKITKDLSVRKWDCPVCGTTHDRDINAAINIRNEGQHIALLP